MKKNVAIGALSLAVLVLLALDARHRERHRILSERGLMVRQAPPPIQALAPKPAPAQPAPQDPSPEPVGEAAPPVKENPPLDGTGTPVFLTEAQSVPFQSVVWKTSNTEWPIEYIEGALELSPEQKLRMNELFQARHAELDAIEASRKEIHTRYDRAISPWMDGRQQKVFDSLMDPANRITFRVTTARYATLHREIDRGGVFQMDERDPDRY